MRSIPVDIYYVIYYYGLRYCIENYREHTISFRLRQSARDGSDHMQCAAGLSASLELSGPARPRACIAFRMISSARKVANAILKEADPYMVTSFTIPLQSICFIQYSCGSCSAWIRITMYGQTSSKRDDLISASDSTSRA